MQLLNELTYHEYKELAETAERLFNKIRAMFAVRGGIEFMEDFIEQAQCRQVALRNRLRRARNRKRMHGDKGSRCYDLDINT